MRRRRLISEGRQVDVQVIPLIDVVFFLLVFYIISSAFISDAALAVERPTSAQARPLVDRRVTVVIAKDGTMLVEEHAVARAHLASAVAAAIADRGTGIVVVIPDREVPAGTLLAVMDACAAAGASRVEVAAVREQE